MTDARQEPAGKALVAFQAALGAITDVRKSETADMGRYTYSYAPLGTVLDEVKRACALFDLAVTQAITHEGDFFAVVTQVIHTDGSVLQFPPIVLPMPREAQALGSAATYLRRYSLLAIFGMGTEDDDGRAATVAATTQPGRRTEAERLIREAMGAMDPDTQKAFTEAFRAEFHAGLADLPASRHGDALTWTREWKPPVDTESSPTMPEPTPGG